MAITFYIDHALKLRPCFRRLFGNENKIFTFKHLHIKRYWQQLYSTGCIWQFRGQSILTPRLCENPTTPNFVAQYTAMDCPTGKMPVKWKGFLCIWTIEKMCCLQLTYKFVPEITAAWSSWGKKSQHIQQGRAFNLNYSQLASGSTHQCQLTDI